MRAARVHVSSCQSRQSIGSHGVRRFGGTLARRGKRRGVGWCSRQRAIEVLCGVSGAISAFNRAATVTQRSKQPSIRHKKDATTLPIDRLSKRAGTQLVSVCVAAIRCSITTAPPRSFAPIVGLGAGAAYGRRLERHENAPIPRPGRRARMEERRSRRQDCRAAASTGRGVRRLAGA